MAQWSRIFGGQVVELIDFNPAGMFHPSLIWAESDGTPGVACGWIASFVNGAWTFSAPAIPVLTLQQQAQASVSAGLTITSTGTPALDGKYTCDGIAQGKIASVSTYILVNSKFPGGAASYPWIDAAGAPHTFPTTGAFQAFATAVADYVAALDQIIATGTGTLPASSAAIP